MKYYSATTNAFYDDAIIATSQMPEDAVVVPDEEFAELMAQQQAGCVIVADTDGTPTYMQQTCGQCTCISHDIVKATNSVLGHVKVGSNIDIAADGTISVCNKETLSVDSEKWVFADGLYSYELETKKPILSVYKEKTGGGYEKQLNINVDIAADGTQTIKSYTAFSGYVLTI